MLSLVFSDLHLDARTCGMPRYDDLGLVLSTLCEAAHQLKVDRALFLGDLCNPGPGAHRCIARAIEFAEALPCPSIWLTGNHDVVEDGTGASVLEPMKAAGYFVVDRPMVTSKFGVDELMLPYVPRAFDYDPAEKVRASQHYGKYGALAIWGHLNLEGITPGSETESMPRGRNVFWPLDVIDQYLPRVPCFGGHYHQAQTYRGVRIVGAPARFTFGEEMSAPRYLTVEQSGKRLRVASTALPSRRVYSIPAARAAEVQEGDIVRFYVTQEDPPEVLAELGNAAARCAACKTMNEADAPKPPTAPELEAEEGGEDFGQVALRIAEEWRIAEEQLAVEVRKLVARTVEQEQSR